MSTSYKITLGETCATLQLTIDEEDVSRILWARMYDLAGTLEFRCGTLPGEVDDLLWDVNVNVRAGTIWIDCKTDDAEQVIYAYKILVAAAKQHLDEAEAA